MSDTVDNVLNTVEESEPADVVVNEATDQVEEAPAEEVEEPEPVTEEVPVEEEPEPVAEEIEEPVSVEEVVQNVQGILTTPVNENLSDKERIVQLETRVDGLINLLRSVYEEKEVDENEFVWFSDFNNIREKLENILGLPEQAQLIWQPENLVKVDDEKKAISILKLLETLDNCEDVQGVYSNFDIEYEIINKINI